MQNVLTKIQNFYQKDQDGPHKESVNPENGRPPPLNKPQYMQNLEKRLNEITAQSFDAKKAQSTLSFKNNELPKEEPARVKNKGNAKKLRLCRQFVKTGLCRQAERCPYAHHVSELDVEYYIKQ